MTIKVCEIDGCDERAGREICRKHQIDVRNGRIPAQPHWYTQPNPKCFVDECDRRCESRKMEMPRCHVHMDQIRRGKDPASVRPKMRNGTRGEKCSWCDLPPRTRGLCEKHYYHLRKILKTDVCGESGCEVRTKNDWCAKHRTKKYRDPMPTGPCAVNACEKRYSSRTRKICKHHNRAKSIMGLSVDEFVYIKNLTECTVCGAEDRLVVDHWHGHHPENKWRMCKKCIRGVMCSRCNSALAFLFEDPEKIRSLADYAENITPGSFFRERGAEKIAA